MSVLISTTYLEKPAEISPMRFSLDTLRKFLNIRNPRTLGAAPPLQIYLSRRPVHICAPVVCISRILFIDVDLKELVVRITFEVLVPKNHQRIHDPSVLILTYSISESSHR